MGPEAIGHVAGELAAGWQHFGQRGAAAELRNAADSLVGFDNILLVLGELWFNEEDGSLGQSRQGFVAGGACEDGFEAGFAVGFFGERNEPGFGVSKETD